MPVIPASANAAITALALLRTAHWVVSAEAATIGGCLIWTAMKMPPATAAATPAARVRLAAVTFMADSLFLLWPDGVSGDVRNDRKRHGEVTSPRDVTGLVIGSRP